jgi:hypothetical protein
MAVGLVGLGLTTATAQTAYATTYAVYQTTANVSARSSPTAAATGVYGVPAGASIDVQCQVIGQPVGPRGNTLYFWVRYAGRYFYVPDTWTNSPHHAGQPPIPGIPMCGSTAAPVPCWAKSCTGKNPLTENCVTGARYLGTYRAWAPSDDVAAYIELYHSDHCGSAYFMAISPFQQTTGTTTSIWNPGGPSYRVRENTNGYQYSMMVDDVPGVTTCLGTQVYYNYGQYYQWQMQICY